MESNKQQLSRDNHGFLHTTLSNTNTRSRSTLSSYNTEWQSRVIEIEKKQIQRLEKIFELELLQSKRREQKLQNIQDLQEQKLQKARLKLKEKEEIVRTKNIAKEERVKRNDLVQREEKQQLIETNILVRQIALILQDEQMKDKQRREQMMKIMQERKEESLKRQLVVKGKRDLYKQEIMESYQKRKNQLLMKEQSVIAKLEKRKQEQKDLEAKRREQIEIKCKVTSEAREAIMEEQKLIIEKKIMRQEEKLIEIKNQKKALKDTMKKRALEKEKEIQNVIMQNKIIEELKKKEIIDSIQKHDTRVKEQEEVKRQEQIERLERERLEEQHRRRTFQQKMMKIENQRKDQLLDKLETKDHILEEILKQKREDNERRRQEEQVKRKQMEQEIANLRLQQQKEKLIKLQTIEEDKSEFFRKRKQEQETKDQVSFIKENITLKKRAIMEEIKAVRDNLNYSAFVKSQRQNFLSNSIDALTVIQISPPRQNEFPESPDQSYSISSQQVPKVLNKSKNASRQQLKSASQSLKRLESRNTQSDLKLAADSEVLKHSVKNISFEASNSRYQKVNQTSINTDEKSIDDYFPIQSNDFNHRRNNRYAALIGISNKSMLVKRESQQLPQIVQSFFLSKNRNTIVDQAFSAYLNPEVYRSISKGKRHKKIRKRIKSKKDDANDEQKISTIVQDDSSYQSKSPEIFL